MTTHGGPYPQWESEQKWRRHFGKHGGALGTKTLVAYDRSARVTIRLGKRFAFRDPDSSLPRVGYFHARTGRLTVLTQSEAVLLTHFKPDRGERYARELPESTY